MTIVNEILEQIVQKLNKLNHKYKKCKGKDIFKHVKLQFTDYGHVPDEWKDQESLWHRSKWVIDCGSNRLTIAVDNECLTVWLFSDTKGMIGWDKKATYYWSDPKLGPHLIWKKIKNRDKEWFTH